MVVVLQPRTKPMPLGQNNVPPSVVPPMKALEQNVQVDAVQKQPKPALALAMRRGRRP